MKFDEFAENVRRWSEERGIFAHSSGKAQLLKAVSEMGELCDAEIKGDREGQLDGVGDILVCLVNYCVFADLDLAECMAAAWEEIKDRKGRMVAGGAFVKDDP
jgi:NTP pyrophosphatase (non-canonical NTP hydrolase)